MLLSEQYDHSCYSEYVPHGNIGPQMCNREQIPFEKTKAINQWRSVGKSPFSDECLVPLTPEEREDDSENVITEEETRGVYLDCTYEEDIAMAAAQTRFEFRETSPYA